MADTATGPTATGSTATGQAATGQTATGPTATGQTATGQATTGSTATAETATGQTATGETATSQTATAQTATTGPTATAETATGQTATGQATTGSTATAETATGQTATGQTATSRTTTGSMAGQTLYDITFAESRDERDRRARARNLIGREDCEPELNRMGTMRWYLHPHLETPSTRALYFHELEIGQGSNSGKLYCQGGIIHYVMAGSGHTVLDGRAHEWEEGDVIAIPIKESGVTYQHFNTGVGPTRMLVCWANLDSAISPEGGVAMEVLEPCPEWQAQHS